MEACFELLIMGLREHVTSPDSGTCCLPSPYRSVTCKHMDSNEFYLAWLPLENIHMGNCRHHIPERILNMRELTFLSGL